MAFRNAILRANKDNNKLEFIPLVRQADPNNSYDAERMGSLLQCEFRPNSVQTSNLERLQDLLENHGPGSNPITIYQLPEDENYHPMLKKIENSQETHIVIDCNPDKVMKIFRQALAIKMLGEYQNYFITSLDSHVPDYSKLEFSRTNITMIRLMDPLSEAVVNATIDWQDSEKRLKGFTNVRADRIKTETALFYDAVQTFLLAFRESNALGSIRSQKLQCTESEKWDHGWKLIESLDKKTNTGMTGRVRFDGNGYRTDFYLEVLELNNDIFKTIAIFNSETMSLSYTRTSEEIRSQVTQSLQNKTVIVASIIGAPFLTERISNETIYEGNDRYERYSVDLIDNIAKIIGFTYRIEIVKDNKQGSHYKKTKKWNGLVKVLLDRVGDTHYNFSVHIANEKQ